jgi:hypothetical protein
MNAPPMSVTVTFANATVIGGLQELANPISLRGPTARFGRRFPDAAADAFQADLDRLDRDLSITTRRAADMHLRRISGRADLRASQLDVDRNRLRGQRFLSTAAKAENPTTMTPAPIAQPAD